MSSTLRRGRLATAFITLLATLGLLAATMPATAQAAPSTGSISGTITDSHGGVSGAVVYVYVQPSDSYTYAATDNSGHYSLTDLPNGTYRLYVVELSHHYSTWYGGTDYTDATGVTVAGNDVTGIDLALIRTGTLTGTVRLPDGNPASGVAIAAWITGRSGAPGDVTNASGQFSITLNPGSFIVQATPASTYPIAFAGPSGATSIRSQAKTYTVTEDGTTTVDITLAAGTVFSGTVTSNGAAPSTEVTVLARQQNGTEWPAVGQATSEAGTGHYSLVVGPGTYYITFHEMATGRYGEQKVTVSSGAASRTLNVDCLTLYGTVATPTITGTAAVASTLTADPGTWNPTPDSFTYQWLRSGAEIPGATASTYTVTTADQGAQLSVVVTAIKASYFHDYYESAPTTAVATLPTPPRKTITGHAPKISGTTKVGKTLKFTRGTWAPSGLTFTYRWYRNGTAIKAATKTTYKVTKSDRGKYLTVKVTANRSGYKTLSLTSKRTARVR